MRHIDFTLETSDFVLEEDTVSKGLSTRQRDIYRLIDDRGSRGLPTSSLDIVEELFPKRLDDTTFRISIRRSLRSLERRGWIGVQSTRRGRRERDSRGLLGYIVVLPIQEKEEHHGRLGL